MINEIRIGSVVTIVSRDILDLVSYTRPASHTLSSDDPSAAIYQKSFRGTCPANPAYLRTSIHLSGQMFTLPYSLPSIKLKILHCDDSGQSLRMPVRLIVNDWIVMSSLIFMSLWE